MARRGGQKGDFIICQRIAILSNVVLWKNDIVDCDYSLLSDETLDELENILDSQEE